MANKFTKSVLERQAKEMRQHPARAAKPAGEGETPVQEAAAVPAAQEAPQAAPPQSLRSSRRRQRAPAPKAAGTARRAARAPRARRQAAQGPPRRPST